MTEYENEPMPGLPGLLPPGERILWQGSPDWQSLARTALHTRAVSGYFAILALIALATALPNRADGPAAFLGVAGTIGTGIIAVALLHLFAWASARSTLYTLTNRRVVLRFGIALPKCVNLPLALVEAAGLRQHPDGTGDLPLTLIGPQPLGYAVYWPHVRPARFARPQPMLRAVPRAADVAALLARACLAASPDGRLVPIPRAAVAPAPAFAEVAA